MIAVVRSATQAEAFLLTSDEDDALVFDLLESLDPNYIPVRLCECKECLKTEIFRLGDTPSDECIPCGGRLEVIAVAGLVIQGSVVLSTNWREP